MDILWQIVFALCYLWCMSVTAMLAFCLQSGCLLLFMAFCSSSAQTATRISNATPGRLMLLQRPCTCLFSKLVNAMVTAAP